MGKICGNCGKENYVLKKQENSDLDSDKSFLLPMWAVLEMLNMSLQELKESAVHNTNLLCK